MIQEKFEGYFVTPAINDSGFGRLGMIDSPRISRDEMLIGVAELVAQRSTCSRAHVGAVIAREGRILTLGYNGSPSGMPHCDHSQDDENYAGCKLAVHAEANCVAFASRYGISLDGSDLYTTFTPCLPCAQLVINAGIRRVFIRNEYRLPDGKQLLVDAGVGIILI